MGMIGFDFGELDKEDKEEPAENVSSSQVTLEQVKKVVAGMGLKKMAKNEAAKVIRGVEGQLKDWFQEELQKYKGDMSELKELWDTIFPTLVRMWGLNNGIGARIARINQVIASETLNKRG